MKFRSNARSPITCLPRRAFHRARSAHPAPRGSTAERSVPHVCVCVCTFQRPALLCRLLAALAGQRTDGRFTFSVVVVDNDEQASARQATEDVQRAFAIDVRYFVEREQNIALARNKAVANTRGDFVAFIDDDEIPGNDWLLTLHGAIGDMGVDGVLGPVVPSYEEVPPAWVLRGRFHERPAHATGTILPWQFARTGNALLRSEIFRDPGNWFREEFGSGGEDRDLFRRLIESGRRFAWCAEAPVWETIPPERFRRRFLLKRALLRGRTPYNQHAAAYLRSTLAIPAYTLMLPFLPLLGHHVFMRYLVSYCDHVGRILALLGARVVKEKYVTR